MAFAVAKNAVAARARASAPRASRAAPCMAAPAPKLSAAAAGLALVLSAAPAHAERILPAINTGTLDKGEMDRMLTIYEARDLELDQNGTAARAHAAPTPARATQPRAAAPKKVPFAHISHAAAARRRPPLFPPGHRNSLPCACLLPSHKDKDKAGWGGCGCLSVNGRLLARGSRVGRAAHPPQRRPRSLQAHAPPLMCVWGGGG